MKMKRNAGKILSLLIIIILAFPRTDLSAFSVNRDTEAEAYDTDGSEDKVLDDSAPARLVRGSFSISDIDNYGNISLSISSADFFEAGYNYGDVVKIKILGKKYRLPFVSNYSDVEQGKTALLARENEDKLKLAINMGDFASSYGLAVKTVSKGGSYEWKYADGVEGPVKVSIWMKVRGGYADEFVMHQLSWSNDRADYPLLTDEEFANFRQVKTTGMGFGILYRTSSPVNPINNRNKYSDNALRAAGVSVILNLADTEESALGYEGFAETYYSGIDHISLAMNMDFQSEEFKNKLAEGLRFMAENPGIYAINCNEGKDCTGFVAALLECLMGASLTEVMEDYMVSYSNYYGVLPYDPRYKTIYLDNIYKTLKNVFAFTKKDKKKALNTRDLSACAVKYLKKIGLTGGEIKKLKKNLSGNLELIDKDVELIKEDGSRDSVRLRFYPDGPNIPYIGLKVYSEALGINIFSSRKDGSGKIVFSNESGASAVADPSAGTLTSDDWINFFNPPAPYSGSSKAFKDSNCDFIRISEVKIEGESHPVTFDLKKYGLNMYSDDQDIYLSLSLIGSMLNDISTRSLVWDGIRVHEVRLSSISSYMDSVLSTNTLLTNSICYWKRSSDIAIESYNELCFDLDYFYGYPGLAAIESAMEENGLDRALQELGEYGDSLIKGLKSTDLLEYYLAVVRFYYAYLDDNGHTSPPSIVTDVLYNSMMGSLGSEAQTELGLLLSQYSSFRRWYVLRAQIASKRDEAWGDDVYMEYGNTAVIRLTDFGIDEAGWEAFYKSDADIPMDSVGIVVSSLKKAAANPDIKNILFDLCTNVGGSSDVLAYIMALTTGTNEILLYDKLTSQNITLVYEADTNLDGVIDDKDRETVYDQFNYGVLTTKHAFSCGNLFPILMKEAGAVLIGEPSGGGSCAVRMVVVPDGSVFQMSSADGVIRNENGLDIEKGCKTDIPIAHKESIEDAGNKIYDYSLYFNLKKLNKMLNKWFAEKEDPEAA